MFLEQPFGRIMIGRKRGALRRAAFLQYEVDDRESDDPA